MKEDRKHSRKRKKKKKKKKKRKRKYDSDSDGSISSEEQSRDQKRVKYDEGAVLNAMTRLVAGRPSLTADLRTVFMAMDNGQSVVLDSIKNEELRKGLRELFDMMRLGKKGKYKVRSSDRGLMMRTFGGRLKEIEAMWEQLKKSKSNEESASSVEPPKETSESTSASAPKKTRLGPARPPADWKPAEVSSSEDDEFGPAPESSAHVRTARPEVLAEMKKREEEMKRKELRNRAKAWHKLGHDVEDKTLLQDDLVTKQTERQSWMTQLPSSRNGSNAFGAIFKKGGKSQFRQRAAKESDGSWTQTPKEKLEKDLAKKREELFGIPLSKKHSAAPQPRKAAPNNASVTSSSKRRGKSLLDMHRERMGNKASSSSQSAGQSEVRWDRDRDMSLKSGSLGSNKSELGKILQSASEMRSRFSSSSNR